MAQNTAIDFFVKDLTVLLEQIADNECDFEEFKHRMKEMIYDAKMVERMQIIEAYYEADLVGGVEEAKKYYNQTYNK
jgi:hypothetical protein